MTGGVGDVQSTASKPHVRKGASKPSHGSTTQSKQKLRRWRGSKEGATQREEHLHRPGGWRTAWCTGSQEGGPDGCGTESQMVMWRGEGSKISQTQIMKLTGPHQHRGWHKIR